MDARFRHGIKLFKIISTFYLPILTFFLRFVRYKVAIACYKCIIYLFQWIIVGQFVKRLWKNNNHLNVIEI